MNKFLIFAGARTGSVCLSHCLRHTIAGTGEDWKDRVCDEPFTQPLKIPNDTLREFMIENCLKLGIDLEKSHFVAKLCGNSKTRGKNVLNRMTIPKLYKLLDIIYGNYTGIKHIHDQNAIWFNKALFDYAADKGIKIIYLHREDLARVTLSGVVSWQEGIWSVIGSEEKKQQVDETVYEPIKVSLLRKQCSNLRKRHKMFTSYLNFKAFDSINIKYEDFLGEDKSIDDRIVFFKDILKRLDYNYVDEDIIIDALSPKCKQHSKKNYDKIPNIKEINEWLEEESKK